MGFAPTIKVGFLVPAKQVIWEMVKTAQILMNVWIITVTIAVLFLPAITQMEIIPAAVILDIQEMDSHAVISMSVYLTLL